MRTNASRDRSQTLNIELILAQIQYLQCSVPLQHLSDVSNAVPDVVPLQIRCLKSTEPWQVVQCTDLFKECRARAPLERRAKDPSISMSRVRWWWWDGALSHHLEPKT